jgi:RNA polymerase sigma factor (TIGR02999 family)
MLGDLPRMLRPRDSEKSARYNRGMSDVTQILFQIEEGDSGAAEKLLPLVYDELKKLAARTLSHENPGHTLQPTALVHEAYLRLVDTDRPVRWENRRHFFAAAAEAMRRILLNWARDKGRLKRGGGRRRIDLDPATLADETSVDDFLDLNEALTRLASEDPVLAELVKLRLFAGLATVEAATVLEIAPRTAERYWSYARAWLFDQLRVDG